MTLSIYNPYTMALNAISMAGNNFRENTIENPDIPVWKRASMAIGSAAIEQAVEKFSDPVFKYFNGGRILSWFGKKASEETSKKIVYPPITMIAKAGTGDRSNAGNESVADSINDSIFSLTGGISGSGAGMKVSMPQPAHKIRLNFSGAAWQELQGKKESSVVKNIGYKAWLRSQMDGGAERVVDDVKSVQYTIPASGSITEDEKDRLPDIYTELLIRLSDKLASGKK
jgi:hypothetical protein